MEKEHSVVASQYRATQTVETLTRVYIVTGQEFPVSGDAWLTRQARILELKARAAYAAALPTRERPC